MQEYPGVKAEFIEADLTNTDPNFTKDIWQKAIKDKEVSMFLACAAIPYNGDILAPDPYAFTAIYPKFHCDTIACVGIQAMYITKLAKEYFATRAGKSAIINITSSGGVMKVLAYNPVYMSTKRFQYNEMYALNADRVDTLQVAPVWVRTKLTGNMPKYAWFIGETEEVAESTVNMLGKGHFTHSTYLQAFYANMLKAVPVKARIWMTRQTTDNIVSSMMDRRKFNAIIKKDADKWFPKFW